MCVCCLSVCVCVCAFACFWYMCTLLHVCINLCVIKIHQRSRPFLYAIPNSIHPLPCTLHVDECPRVSFCVCVCMSVCVSVCVHLCMLSEMATELHQDENYHIIMGHAWNRTSFANL